MSCKVQQSTYNGIPSVELHHANGDQVVVTLLGATVVKYVHLGKDVLFLSKKALFQAGKAIRGGIPICFPQFGPGSLPQHGFARNNVWNFSDSGSKSDSCFATFTLMNSEETEKVWPHQFKADYKVELLADKLHITMTVHNQGQTDLSFTTALHTYLQIPNIRTIGIKGLKGTTYHDKISKQERVKEEDEELKFTQEVDRVYFNTNDEVVAKDDSNNVEIVVQKQGFQDIVTWNIWSEKIKNMSDMSPEEYNSYVCIETAVVGNPVVVQPSHQWKGTTSIISKL